MMVSARLVIVLVKYWHRLLYLIRGKHEKTGANMIGAFFHISVVRVSVCKSVQTSNSMKDEACRYNAVFNSQLLPEYTQTHEVSYGNVQTQITCGSVELFCFFRQF